MLIGNDILYNNWGIEVSKTSSEFQNYMKKSRNNNVIYSKDYVNFSDYIDIQKNFIECTECILNRDNYFLIVCCYETKIDYDIAQSVYRYAQGLNSTIQDFLNLKI